MSRMVRMAPHCTAARHHIHRTTDLVPCTLSAARWPLAVRPPYTVHRGRGARRSRVRLRRSGPGPPRVAATRLARMLFHPPVRYAVISPGLIDLICTRLLFLAKAQKHTSTSIRCTARQTLQADTLPPKLPSTPALLALPLFSLPWFSASWVLSLCSKHLPHSHVRFGAEPCLASAVRVESTYKSWASAILRHTTQPRRMTDQTLLNIQASIM